MLIFLTPPAFVGGFFMQKKSEIRGERPRPRPRRLAPLRCASLATLARWPNALRAAHHSLILFMYSFPKGIKNGFGNHFAHCWMSKNCIIKILRKQFRSLANRESMYHFSHIATNHVCAKKLVRFFIKNNLHEVLHLVCGQ